MSIQKIAVIGAGTMGRGIAYSAAAAGLSVILQDVSEASLEKSKSYLQTQFDRSVSKELLSKELADERFREINYTTELSEAARDRDLVIEAVLELMELKTSIFKQLDE
ncbi:3-hydroxyacyl-CoA dehydrogenase NAD-binding domain-containing protein, partial [Pantoea sp. SIMBA_133]